MDDQLSELYKAIEAAQAEFTVGRPQAFQELWSAAEDVTIFGAFGGHEVGWTEVEPRLGWAASQFRNGSWEYTPLAAAFGRDLGYTVGLERLAACMAGATLPTIQELRVTHVFRRDADGWRIIHRHGDPLTTKMAPLQPSGRA